MDYTEYTTSSSKFTINEVEFLIKVQQVIFN